MIHTVRNDVIVPNAKRPAMNPELLKNPELSLYPSMPSIMIAPYPKMSIIIKALAQKAMPISNLTKICFIIKLHA